MNEKLKSVLISVPLIFVILGIAAYGSWLSVPVDPSVVSVRPEECQMWYKTPEGWTAAFTFGLFISTTGLWWFTAFMWKATQKAANAAKDAAEALPILERAYLYFDKVKSPGFEFYKVNAGETRNVPIDRWQGRIHGQGLIYTVINHGNTPATITEVMGKVAFLPYHSADMPPPIDVSNEKGILNYNSIAVAGKKKRKLSCSISLSTENGSIIDIREQRKILFVLGYVRYIDIFGKKHRLGFCLQYDDQSEVFWQNGGEGYNYTCDEG